METLTPEGQRVAAELSQRYGFSQDAVIQMMLAMLHGRGAMAQFNHPEFAGSGQWMRGGMLMLGDMFNHALKARVDGLCQAIAAQLANQPELFPSGSFQSQSQSGGGQQLQTGDGGQQMQVGGGGQQMQVASSAAGRLSSTPLTPMVETTQANRNLFATNPNDRWWPPEFGTPSAIGAQNDLRYAFFPSIGRLAVETLGQLRVYDTGEHHIAGLSQQQGPGGGVVFTTPGGSVSLTSLSSVAGGAVQQAQSTATGNQQQLQNSSMGPMATMAPLEGMVPMTFTPMAPIEAWWPAELGTPSSSGSQNNLRYAVFPAARRLAVECNGRVSVHDSGDLQITGCSMAGPDGEATFSSDRGTIELASLPLVQPASPAASRNQVPEESPGSGLHQVSQPAEGARPERAATPGSEQADAEARNQQTAVLDALAKLGELKALGVLTEDEFKAKKTELLARL